MPESEIYTIPQVRAVHSTTWALFPASARVGDLAYATDRLVLYRWDGAAWQPITIHSSSGTAGNIPAVASMPEGSLYYETDTGQTQQVQTGAWVVINTHAYSFTPLAGGEDHSPAGFNAWEDWDISGSIPAGAVYALIHCRSNDAAARREVGVRNNGSALVRSDLLGIHETIMILTLVDAARICEIYVAAVAAALVCNVWGYWS